jgi:hypothetical protein
LIFHEKENPEPMAFRQNTEKQKKKDVRTEKLFAIHDFFSTLMGDVSDIYYYYYYYLVRNQIIYPPKPCS